MLIAQSLDNIESNGLPHFAFGLSGPVHPANVINAVLPYVFGAAAIAVLIYLVMGGLQMMTSGGDPKAMQGAQAKITNALIGFVIISFAFSIVSIIGKIFGITVFGNIFK